MLPKNRSIKIVVTVFSLIHFNNAFAQDHSRDTSKKYTCEICVLKKGKPGHILKNERTGVADTIVAFVNGYVQSNDGAVPFANISFTNSKGKVAGTSTDLYGNYSIILNSGIYTVRFFALDYSEFNIKNLKLGTGQIQNISVDLGSGGKFCTYLVKFDHTPSKKEIKAKEKELAGD